MPMTVQITEATRPFITLKVPLFKSGVGEQLGIQHEKFNYPHLKVMTYNICSEVIIFYDFLPIDLIRKYVLSMNKLSLLISSRDSQFSKTKFRF